MDLKIKLLTKTAKLPVYATPGAAAADIFADISEPLTLKAGCRALIPTGLAVQVEENSAVFIFARSGLAVRQGITLSNCVGVVDSDYRGEVKVGLFNSSGEDYTVKPGERIAQLAVMPVSRPRLTVCEELEQTARGEGGFGSTGKQ